MRKLKLKSHWSLTLIIKLKAFLLRSSFSYPQSESSSARRRLTKSSVFSVGQIVSLSQTSFVLGSRGAMFWCRSVVDSVNDARPLPAVDNNF